MSKQIENRLDTHEAVCAERWAHTVSRIKRLETIMIGTAGTTIVLLLSLVIKGFG